MLRHEVAVLVVPAGDPGRDDPLYHVLVSESWPCLLSPAIWKMYGWISISLRVLT